MFYLICVKIMFRPVIYKTKNLKGTELYTAKSLEKDLEEIISQKKPIEASAPLLYTEKKDGVIEDCDIRTDKWEAMQRAATYVNEQKREYRKADAEGRIENGQIVEPGNGGAEN